MSSLETARKDLEQFGLSSKQAEIYLLLVTQQDLRIQEIVKLTGMPRSSVYENLRHLYELGIAEEIVGETFKRVRAYPIGVLRHSLDETIASLQRQLGTLDTLEKSIGQIGQGNTGPTTVRYYKNRIGARQIYWNSLKANDTVYVYSAWGRQQYVGLKYYENFVLETKHRNLSEKVLVNLTPQILETIRSYTVPGSPLYRTKVEDIRVLTAEQVHIKGDTLIYNDIYAQVYLQNVQIHGFEVASRDFVDTQRSIFETLWHTARPVAEFL